MRIGVAQFFHESNSFCPSMTTEEHFRADAYLTGDNLFDRWRDTDSEIAGILDVAGEDLDIELVPVIGAWSWPSGPVTDVVYVKVARAIISACLEDRLDGLLLCLHGAAVTETHLDAEGDLLDAIRHRVGRDFPIVATLDFHANVSPRMVELLDGFVGYKTYPHVDYRERGQDACRMIASIAREEIAPTIGYSHPPLLFVPQRQWTAYDPMLPIMQRAHEIEQHDDRVLVANVFGGFCYSDTPYAGFSTSVITNNNPDLAQYYADELAQMAWDNRQKFVPELLYVTDAVTQAVKASDGLTVLVDIGDNIGGGTPGDGTILLRELIRQKATNTVVILCDGEAAWDCASAGIGSTVGLRVGGNHDEWHGAPVKMSGRVRMLFDGVYKNRGDMRDGITEYQGLTARVDCGGIELILTTRKMPPWNLEQLRSVGIDPTQVKVLVAKSAIAFRAAYEPIAARILEVDTPGLTSANLQRFPYRRLRRPIFPLDAGVEFE